MDAKASTVEIRATGSRDIAAIQYLRGIAAMMVVFAHANGQFATGIRFAFQNIGWSGVDLFFVISGFVMTYTVGTRSYSWSEFARNRFARVVPFYWLATIMTAAVLILAPWLYRHSVFTWPLFLSSLAFWPVINPVDGDITPILKLGWTLNYEMAFYLVFSMFLRSSPMRRVLDIGVVFAGFIFLADAMHPAPIPVQFYGAPVTLEFLAGCVIGGAYLHGWLSRTPFGMALLGLVAGFFLIIYGGVLNEPLAEREIFRGIPAAVVILSAVALHNTSSFRNDWLHRIGDATYSIYLTHLIVVMGGRLIIVKLHLQSEAVIWLYIFSSVPIAAVLGIVANRFIESPLILYTKRRLSPRPKGL